MIEFKPGTYGYIAEKDLNAALTTVRQLPSLCGMCAQQAVEKMFKQYLKEVQKSTDLAVFHTHNIRRLHAASGLDILPEYLGKLYSLTDAYFNTRYPGDEYWELTSSEAEELYKVAAAIVSLVEMEIAKFREEDACL